VSVQAVALAEGVLRAMSRTKVRFITVLLLALAVAGAGAGVFTLQALAGKPAEGERPEAGSPPASDPDPPPPDRYGDAVRAGAVPRLGTVRFRTRGGSPWIAHRPSPGVAFLPGDRTVAALASGEIEFLDVATGKEVRRAEAPGWKWAYTLSPDGKTLA